MRRALTPKRSETKLDNLMWHSSNKLSSWFCSRTWFRVSWYLRRVTVRQSRCSASGTKLRFSSFCYQPLHQTFGIRKILLAAVWSAIRVRSCEVHRSRSRSGMLFFSVDRFRVPLQHFPNWFPILRG